jgi:hypothetical protein
MESKKQTAVEWLVDELSLKSMALKIMLNAHKEIYEKAKEMEKQQIEDAYRNGKVNSFDVMNIGAVNITSEQYYNETFKSE